MPIPSRSRQSLVDFNQFMKAAGANMKKVAAVAMPEIREILATGIEVAFRTETSPDGVRWEPPKSPVNNGKLLVRTGTLQRAAISAARKVVIEGNRLTARLEGVSYAAFHQFGTRRMPARPFFGIWFQARMKIGKIVKKAVDKQLADAKKV